MTSVPLGLLGRQRDINLVLSPGFILPYLSFLNLTSLPVAGGVGRYILLAFSALRIKTMAPL